MEFLSNLYCHGALKYRALRRNIIISEPMLSIISGIFPEVLSEHHLLISLTVAGTEKSLSAISAEYAFFKRLAYPGMTGNPLLIHTELALEMMHPSPLSRISPEYEAFFNAETSSALVSPAAPSASIDNAIPAL